jgi:hypothetical protein
VLALYTRIATLAAESVRGFDFSKADSGGVR